MLLDGGVDGVFGFVGGVDCVGQFALASITDRSGHVFVVGVVDGGTDVNGGVVVDGVNDWVHDGSVGFFVQSTGGGVPEVQLPAAHVFPLPFPPPDVEIDLLLGCIAADDADDIVVLTFGHVVLSLHVNGGGVGVIPCSFASCISQSLVLRFLSGSVMALLSVRSHLNICGSHFPVTGSYTCPG